MLRKGGSNWVEEDRFFDRKVELEILTDPDFRHLDFQAVDFIGAK